jgi:hypothetical protein
VANNWAKWDAAHAGEEKAREAEYDAKRDADRKAKEGERSADKLAAMIKGTVGHKGGERGASVHGSGGSVVHRSTKADMKRAPQVKGEKDSADSARTKIRMAAHYRGKKGESPETGDIKPEPGNTGRIRSADKLAAAVRPTDGGGVAAAPSEKDLIAYGTARRKAFEAGRKADTENTAESYRAAADAHTKASSLASRMNQKDSHDTQAAVYRHQAQSLEAAGATKAPTASSADKLAAAQSKKAKDDYTAARKDAIGAEAKADLSGSAADHTAAAQAHTKAASLAQTKAQRDMHLARASSSSTKASDIANGPADMRKADAQVSKDRAATAKVADQNASTGAGAKYKQARQDQLDARRALVQRGYGEDGTADSAKMKAAELAQKRLWPKMTNRDVAESVIQMPREGNPEVYDAMADQLTQHVAFTGKNDVWKKATVDIGNMSNYGLKNTNAGKVNGVTLHGQHVVLSSDLVGHSHAGRQNVKNHGFKTGWSATPALGSDDRGGHLATLSHEIGHVMHHATFGSKEVPHTHGESHMSEYGKTNKFESAAEAYSAAFARAHGHQYSNDKLADAGDQIAAQARKGEYA